MLARNTIKPQTQYFTLQGTDQLFLVYQPTFYNLNGRRQLIASAAFEDQASWQAYVDAVNTNPDAVYVVKTSELTTVDGILDAKSFLGDIEGT